MNQAQYRDIRNKVIAGLRAISWTKPVLTFHEEAFLLDHLDRATHECTRLSDLAKSYAARLAALESA